jgi:3-hydroxyisobutyrate dehydrogenase-like beta-hydroxyacid dehydrogenase
MEIKTVALLHPGNMGSTIGAAAATSGVRVLWASEGRSDASRDRARQSSLIETRTLAEAVRASQVVLSVCPPEAAVEMARKVAGLNFSGIYVDANAVSRFTAEAIGRIVTQSGAGFVDGGIIGAPVKKSGTTRLYLSGERAREVAELFARSMLDARVIGAIPGAASALKLAYAAWTKGTDILLLAIRTLAAHEGIDEALLQEWSVSQKELENRCLRAAAVATPKAWRYVGEMEEIAEAFEAAGLSGGFHKAAADVCRRLTRFKDQTDPAPTLLEVIETLRQTTKP